MSVAVFALSITWPATPEDDTLYGQLCSVGEFVQDNRDDLEMVAEAIATVAKGDVYYGGGGSGAPFEIRAVSASALAEHLDHMAAAESLALPPDEGGAAADDIEFPELDEIVEALTEHVAAGDAFTATNTNYQPLEGHHGWQRWHESFNRLRSLLADIERATEANFGEALSKVPA